MQSIIKGKQIFKSYDELQVLKGVDIEINKGEVVSIVGPSGAGKTTLLHILGTLDKADNNPNTKLEIDGERISGLGDKAIAKFRNQNIGFIFQFHQLLPEFTALENVCIPAYISQGDKGPTEKRAKDLLYYLGLSERYHHKPNSLSGGEQQRVAVARALINEPKIIFADEPSGNLDSATANQLHELFFQLRTEFNQTFVIVTHNTDLANMADRKLTMVDGQIIS